jgi:hypothetical protein
LLPAIDRLPHTLITLRPFAQTLTNTLATDIRPLIRHAEPVVAQLAPAAAGLRDLVPNLTSTFQTLQYATNELAYNPGGNDPGYLYWLDWWSANGLSVFSSADAHGMLGRAAVFANCQQLDATGALEPLLGLTLGVGGLCPS